ATIPFIALWGIAAPPMQSLMVKHVDPASQGKLQGAIASIRALTSMAGPLLFTQVFTRAISPAAPLKIPGAPYLVAAILLAAALLLALFVTRTSSVPAAVPAETPAD